MNKYIEGLRFVPKGHFNAKGRLLVPRDYVYINIGLRFVPKGHFSAKGLRLYKYRTTLYRY